MRSGEVWLVNLDPTAGYEQRGTRPVVVVSAEAFNRLTGTPVVVPVTGGGNFARRRGFAVSLDGGHPDEGVVRCDQPRTLDFAGGNARRLESVPEQILDARCRWRYWRVSMVETRA